MRDVQGGLDALYQVALSAGSRAGVQRQTDAGRQLGRHGPGTRRHSTFNGHGRRVTDM